MYLHQKMHTYIIIEAAYGSRVVGIPVSIQWNYGFLYSGIPVSIFRNRGVKSPGILSLIGLQHMEAVHPVMKVIIKGPQILAGTLDHPVGHHLPGDVDVIAQEFLADPV